VIIYDRVEFVTSMSYCAEDIGTRCGRSRAGSRFPHKPFDALSLSRRPVGPLHAMAAHEGDRARSGQSPTDATTAQCASEAGRVPPTCKRIHRRPDSRPEPSISGGNRCCGGLIYGWIVTVVTAPPTPDSLPHRGGVWGLSEPTDRFSRDQPFGGGKAPSLAPYCSGLLARNAEKLRRTFQASSSLASLAAVRHRGSSYLPRSKRWCKGAPNVTRPLNPDTAFVRRRNGSLANGNGTTARMNRA